MRAQTSTNESAGRVATGLGYAGLIPFLVSVALLWYPPLQALALASLSAYAAVILSFLGAVHWGVALGGTPAPSANRYAWGVLPALAAWCFVLLPQRYALPLLAAAFVVWWWRERTLPDHGFPAWYLPLRTRLTVVVVLALIVGWLRLYALG